MGPILPDLFDLASIVEHPSGNGVILLGGFAHFTRSEKLYFLKNGGILTKWVLLPQTIKTPTLEFFAFALPFGSGNCSIT